MTITRERQPHHPGRQIGRRGDPRPCERSNAGIRDLYRKYAGSGRINDLTGAVAPVQTVDKAVSDRNDQTPFSTWLDFKPQKWLKRSIYYASQSSYLCCILASFFKFMHAKVSPAFISIRAFPYICVYRKP